MKTPYLRIMIGEVKPGDDVFTGSGDLFRVNAVEVADDAVCLHGHSFEGNHFSKLHGTFADVHTATVILVSRVLGLQVRMSEALKEKLGGECRKLGSHTGPFDSDEEDKACYKCSWEHVKEFENEVGVVRDVSDYNNCEPGVPEYDFSKVGPELDVYWGNLRYAYAREDLDVVDAP